MQFFIVKKIIVKKYSPLEKSSNSNTEGDKIVSRILHQSKTKFNRSSFIKVYIDCSNIVRDPKLSHFFWKKYTLENWDTLETFAQKILFLTIIKQKRKKVGHLLVWKFGEMDCISEIITENCATFVAPRNGSPNFHIK